MSCSRVWCHVLRVVFRYKGELGGGGVCDRGLGEREECLLVMSQCFQVQEVRCACWGVC